MNVATQTLRSGVERSDKNTQVHHKPRGRLACRAARPKRKKDVANRPLPGGLERSDTIIKTRQWGRPGLSNQFRS